MKKILILGLLCLFINPSCKKKSTIDSKLPESLEVQISNLTPSAQVIQISDVHGTSDICLFRFYIKASNVTLNIKRNLSITLTSSANINNVADGFRLKVNGQTLEVGSPHLYTSNGVITFNNFDFHINDNDSALVSVSLDARSIGGSGFLEGTTFKAEITKSQVQAITAYDQYGDAFTGDHKGFATGEVITFRR